MSYFDCLFLLSMIYVQSFVNDHESMQEILSNSCPSGRENLVQLLCVCLRMSVLILKLTIQS